MTLLNSQSTRPRYIISRVLVAILAIGLISDFTPARANGSTPTFTVPTSPITANEQTPTQVFPGITLVDSGTNYSGGWIEYAVDTSTAADGLFLETVTVASTTLDSITVVGTTIFKGNGSAAAAIGNIDGVKNGKNGNNLRINFTNSFTNGSFTQNTASVVGDVVSLAGWTAYKRRVILGGVSTIEGWPTPTDNALPGRTDGTTGGDQSTASNSYSVNSSYAGRGGSGFAVQLSTSGNCATGYCIIRGPYIASNSPVYLTPGDQVKFWWSAIGASDAYDVYGYLLNVDTGAKIQLLNSTGANASATQAWTQVTRTMLAGETGSYKFVFIAGTWDATGGRVEGASLLLDDVEVITSATTGISAANLQDLSLLLRYTVLNDAPEVTRVVRISTNNNAVGGVQTINVTPVNDPIAMQDPGSISRLRNMSDSSTATSTFIAYDPDTATVTAVPADFRIVGGTYNSDSGTSSLVGNYGLLSVDTVTGVYTYSFFVDTITALSADAFETFTVTAFDGTDTATGQLKIKLLGTLPVSSGNTARTIAFSTPAPLTFSMRYGDTFTVVARPSAGANDGTITYSDGVSSACGVIGDVVTITSATGTCVISASISAGTTYATANTTVNVVVTVTKRMLTVDGRSQEMVYGQAEPNLGAYDLVGTLASGDAISVTGVRLVSFVTGVTPVGITVVFAAGSASNYDLTVNDGSLVVAPAQFRGPTFGEPVRQLGGFTVVINNYNPTLKNTIKVSAGTVTIVGPVDGVYSAVVTGITGEVTVDLVTDLLGYAMEYTSTIGGPLYIQTITLDLSSLEKTVIGLSKGLKPLTTISPEGEGLTYTSLTPAVCEIKLAVLVYTNAAGTCTIKASANPAPRIQPGASATSSFEVAAPKAVVAATPAPTPTPTPTPAPTPTPTPTQKICQPLGTVYFGTGSATITARTLRELTKAAKQINNTTSQKVCIVGFTDSRGSVAYNLALSKRRVDAVYQSLVGLLQGQAISRDFKGKANPVAVNDSPTKGMAQNRRVEIGIEK